MKLVTTFIILHLFNLFAWVSADIDGELRKSIETVMKCQYRDPPKGPVVAVTPARFTQIVVILHDRFQTPACGRSSKAPVDVTDERTWPFCVFGRCAQGKCQCAGHFSGPKCSIYTKKCWLMYCYLTSCHPSHQSLHCICDPALYGTKITSGIYWYNEGKSSKFMPPPPGWKDDPTNAMQWRGDPAAEKVSSDQKLMVPNVLPAKHGSQALYAPSSSEENKNQELSGSVTGQKKKTSYPKAIASLPGFDSAGRVSGSKARYRERTGEDTIVEDKDKEEKDKKSEKTDIEQALEQLEEVSAATILNACNIYIFFFIVLIICC